MKNKVSILPAPLLMEDSKFRTKIYKELKYLKIITRIAIEGGVPFIFLIFIKL